MSAMETEAPLPSAQNEVPREGIAGTRRLGVVRSQSSGSRDVPEMVRAAGERAVCAYLEFLDDARWSPNMRELYGQRARRFLRWAESRGLTLGWIDAYAIAEYAGELSATKSEHDVNAHLVPVRALFRHLADSEVRRKDPCPRSGLAR